MMVQTEIIRKRLSRLDGECAQKTDNELRNE